MKTSLFDFTLPHGHIATAPANPRDSSRMLVIGDNLQDKNIADIIGFLRAGDVMVFNDTKVIPARLFGLRGNAKIEVLLHKSISLLPLPLGEGGVRAKTQEQIALTPQHVCCASSQRERGLQLWQCFAKPAKKLRVADMLTFADDFCAEVVKKYDDGQVLLSFAYSADDFQKKLDKYGTMPLPPYIEKNRHADESDNNNYQTVYAKNSGSVAAPTAGLHFTKELLDKIDAIGVKRVHVTLHVGGGTFLPVKSDDTESHIMHSEYAEISGEAARIINNAKQAGGRVIAVGTTSVRTLESAANGEGILQEFAGETNIFITPSYKFKIVDAMLTNFHLPKSTLFMLVCAFAGLEKMQSAYAHAIAQNYRFYSYGDACFLLRGRL
ncbi:MAG: tRNA preQ1(34) S-adenosylmethionine ribosyltransferase-isomerase QueA [Pseudomonadota bacterium]